MRALANFTLSLPFFPFFFFIFSNFQFLFSLVCTCVCVCVCCVCFSLLFMLFSPLSFFSFSFQSTEERGIARNEIANCATSQKRVRRSLDKLHNLPNGFVLLRLFFFFFYLTYQRYIACVRVCMFAACVSAGHLERRRLRSKNLK